MADSLKISKIKEMFPFLLVIGLSFYLLPFLINNTGMGMLVLLIGIPLICLVCSIVYGVMYSFNVLYAVFVAVLFLPTVFIFYNDSALVYVLAYGIVSLVGNAVGMVFCRRRRKS